MATEQDNPIVMRIAFRANGDIAWVDHSGVDPENDEHLSEPRQNIKENPMVFEELGFTKLLGVYLYAMLEFETKDGKRHFGMKPYNCMWW